MQDKLSYGTAGLSILSDAKNIRHAKSDCRRKSIPSLNEKCLCVLFPTSVALLLCNIKACLLTWTAGDSGAYRFCDR